MTIYRLTQNDVEKLFGQKIEGGGFRGLMAKLQDRTNKDTCEIELTEEIEKQIVKYANYDESKGGWEHTVLNDIFSKFNFFN